MSSEKDYTKYSFRITALVILLLVCVAFIPPFTIGGVVVKRASILSDIVTVEDEISGVPSLESILDTSFLVGFEFPDDREKTGQSEETDSHYVTANDSSGNADNQASAALASAPGSSAKIAAASDHIIKAGPVASPGVTCAVVENPELVAIEDFSPGQQIMNRFYNALAYEAGERVVRIAVLGDSFIESDIITADMREDLQLTYGGSGVGFVPFTTPLSKHRGTVKHSFSDWDYYNVMQKKNVPEEYRDKFSISGMISVPKQGATVHYEGVKFRRRIEATNTATLLFANRGASKIGVTINDSLSMSYAPQPNDSMIKAITVNERPISKLDITVGDPAGFIGYGVVLEDSVGVSVHNYSVRSNSGLAIFGTDAEINRQIGSLMSYDLIILQYGLNVMSNDIFDYGYYERHLTRIIDYVKQCFPDSAILIMSVGDRSTLKSGTAVTMPEVKAMIKTQRNAAVKGGVGFWNTLEGMGGENSMAEFVKNQWASKDHTHINYSGGRQIATRFVAYMKAAVDDIREQDSRGRRLTPEELRRVSRWAGAQEARSISARKLRAMATITGPDPAPERPRAGNPGHND